MWPLIPGFFRTFRVQVNVNPNGGLRFCDQRAIQSEASKQKTTNPLPQLLVPPTTSETTYTPSPTVPAPKTIQEIHSPQIRREIRATQPTWEQVRLFQGAKV